MAADDLPDGFEVDALPDGFEPAGKQEVQGPPASAARPLSSDVERMISWAKDPRNASNPMAQKLMEVDAKRGNTAERATRGVLDATGVPGWMDKERAVKAGTALTNANVRGGDLASMGWADEAAGALSGGDYKGQRDAFRKVIGENEKDWEKQPLAMRIPAAIASGLPTAMMGPAGYAGAAGMGALAGLGNSTSDSAGGQAVDTAEGATLGALGQALFGGDAYRAGKKAIGATLETAGKVAQLPKETTEAAMALLRKDPTKAKELLSRLFAKEQSHPYASPVSKPTGASYNEAARAVAPEQLPYGPKTEAQFIDGDVIPSVAKQGNGNIRPDDWQPIPAETREARLAALDAIAKRGAGQDAEMIANAPTFVSEADKQAMIRSMQDDARAAAQRRMNGTGDNPRALVDPSADIPTKQLKVPAVDDAITMNTPRDEGIALQQRMLDNHPEVAHDLPWRKAGDSQMRNVPAPPFSGNEIPGQNASVTGWMDRSLEKSPYQRAAAKFDNAGESLNWDMLDKGMKQSSSEVKAANAAITPENANTRNLSADPRVQKIIDAQRDNPEALAAFGPGRDDERGFLHLGAMGSLAMGAGKGLVRNVGINGLARAGAAAEKLGAGMQTAESLTKSWLGNPGLLQSIAQRNDQMGAGARFALQGLQEGGQDGYKARLFLLQSQPFLRGEIAKQQER